jgi:protein involved in polysaccharide export with SLBB domain
LRELIKKVYVQLRERHVQTTQELKDLLEMDDLSSLTALLERMTIFVKDRYYLKSLEKDELTSARNKLLELMLQSEGPFTK